MSYNIDKIQTLKGDVLWRRSHLLLQRYRYAWLLFCYSLTYTVWEKKAFICRLSQLELQWFFQECFYFLIRVMYFWRINIQRWMNKRIAYIIDWCDSGFYPIRRAVLSLSREPFSYLVPLKRAGLTTYASKIYPQSVQITYSTS